MADPHDPYAALRIVDYRRVLAGNLLSSIGQAIQVVAVGWDLYVRTNDPLSLGLVGLARYLPMLLFFLPAGHAADRYSRKHLVMSANGLICLAGTGLAALSWYQGPIPLVYVCLFIAGIGDAFTRPARAALVPQVVPLELLANAVTWNSSGWQIAATIGPALGGFIIALFGGHAAFAFVAAAICYAASIVLLATVRPRPTSITREPVSIGSLTAGIQFVAHSPLILATLTLDLFAVLFGGATALLPVYARDILHGGPTALGWLRGAPGLGALLMALVMAHRPPLRRAGPTLLFAVAGFGLATIVFGLSENFALSFLMLAVIGALDNISVVVRGTLIQVLTPDSMRGRVSAVNSLFIGSSNELGDFESGSVAALFGPVISVVGGGVGTLLVVLSVGLGWPQVWRLGQLHLAGHETTNMLEPMLEANTEFLSVDQETGSKSPMKD
jgi:MFS family permease